MADWPSTMRRRIEEADFDARTFGPGLARVRQRDIETLRRILRSWEMAVTPEGRKFAELGIPSSPFDGGFA